MTPKLAIEHLTKSYRAVRAVDDLSLEVAPGCTFGLLGRNGAGKTTTISSALGLTRPDVGLVWFDGRALQPDTLQTIAYVPETLALAGWMTPREYVEYHRRIYKRFDVRRARELVELFGVPFDRAVRKLSQGQRASIALVLAFAQRADLIFLDEPASGLDPRAQLYLLDAIVQAGAEGATVIFSSHQIAHIERAAEEVAIVDRGKVVVRGNVDELRLGRKVVEATFETPSELSALRNDPAVLDIENDGVLVRVRVLHDSENVSAALHRLGARSIRTLDQSLEDIFLAAVPAGVESA
jgi:ABC-2 type transport system ATP-binding protein